jgi:hypothetical protein
MKHIYTTNDAIEKIRATQYEIQVLQLNLSDALGRTSLNVLKESKSMLVDVARMRSQLEESWITACKLLACVGAILHAVFGFVVIAFYFILKRQRNALRNAS